MSGHRSDRLPSIGSLIVFECAARHENFTKAASELQTSQPAVSGQIARLENQVSARLFERTRSGVTLTAAGRHLLDAAVVALGVLHSAAEEATRLSPSNQVVIACAHDSSHLVVFPRYDALRDAVGRENMLRLLTYQRFPRDAPYDPAADIVLTWSAARAAPGAAEEDRALVFREEVRPVCSLGYASAHADTLKRPVAEWGGLTFLNLTVPNLGWAAWSDWFEIAGLPHTTPVYQGFDSYIQVLEATAAGLGIALGWRGYIERHLDSRAIIALAEDFVEFDGQFVALLTAKGRRNPLARKCLAFFGREFQRPASGPG